MSDSLVDDFSFAVIRRTATAGFQHLLYDVNLATGEITNGALVGLNINLADLSFNGGFAVIPEPSGLALCGIAAACLLRVTRRKRK